MRSPGALAQAMLCPKPSSCTQSNHVVRGRRRPRRVGSNWLQRWRIAKVGNMNSVTCLQVLRVEPLVIGSVSLAWKMRPGESEPLGGFTWRMVMNPSTLTVAARPADLETGLALETMRVGLPLCGRGQPLGAAARSWPDSHD